MNYDYRNELLETYAIQQHLYESDSYKEKLFKMSFLKDPKRAIKKVKDKFVPFVSKLIGANKVKQVMKNALSDSKAIGEKFESEKYKTSNRIQQKDLLMKIAKDHVSKKYNLEKDSSTHKINLLFNGILFLVMMNFLVSDIQEENTNMIALDIVIGAWCLYDALKALLALTKKEEVKISI